MPDLGVGFMGKGPPVPYERCGQTNTGAPPEPSRPEAKRHRVAELLSAAGYPATSADALLQSVDAWRYERRVPKESIATLGAEYIAHYDALCAKKLVP